MNGNDAPLYPFHIFYLDHRFALMQGDPCLGKIEAATQEEAEREAISQGLGSGHTIVVTHIPDNGVSYRDTKTGRVSAKFPFSGSTLWYPFGFFDAPSGSGSPEIKCLVFELRIEQMEAERQRFPDWEPYSKRLEETRRLLEQEQRIA